MTRINLLPWREARRARRQKEFVGMLLAGVLVAAIGVIGAHMFMANEIANQQTRNRYLQDEINRLKRIEKEIQEMDEAKARLLGRLEIIQNLQRSRPIVVQVFDEMVRRLPEEIFLKSFQAEGPKLSIQGTAQSNNVVSGFMRELEQSNLFGEPALTVVENKAINRIRASDFQLQVNRATPKPGDEGDEGTGG
jgi:type IV pilus assembly protein PilN